ncbi:hypothetical protein ACU686_01550 [Yinghuangia aomiensis]
MSGEGAEEFGGGVGFEDVEGAGADDGGAAEAGEGGDAGGDDECGLAFRE